MCERRERVLPPVRAPALHPVCLICPACCPPSCCCSLPVCLSASLSLCLSAAVLAGNVVYGLTAWLHTVWQGRKLHRSPSGPGHRRPADPAAEMTADHLAEATWRRQALLAPCQCRRTNTGTGIGHLAEAATNTRPAARPSDDGGDHDDDDDAVPDLVLFGQHNLNVTVTSRCNMFFTLE